VWYIVGSRPGQGQGLCKDNEISIWCLFVKHAALRSKNKDCINIISNCGKSKDYINIISNCGKSKDYINIISNCGKNKDYINIISNCGKSKDYINIISNCGLLFCSANTVKPQTKCVGLVHTRHYYHHHVIKM
jgi:glutaredoxin-related protein